MAYKLIITEKAEELLDNLIYHLIYRLKNTRAAVHLFDSIDSIYDRLDENPFRFPESRDVNLRRRGYREEVLTDMDYVIIFQIEEVSVYVTGIFHQLENYRKKEEQPEQQRNFLEENWIAVKNLSAVPKSVCQRVRKWGKIPELAKHCFAN